MPDSLWARGLAAMMLPLQGGCRRFEKQAIYASSSSGAFLRKPHDGAN